MRARMNQEFQNFVKKVEEQAKDLEFDIPYRDLGFYGVPNKSTSFIMPAVNALVELTEPPVRLPRLLLAARPPFDWQTISDCQTRLMMLRLGLICHILTPPPPTPHAGAVARRRAQRHRGCPLRARRLRPQKL